MVSSPPDPGEYSIGTTRRQVLGAGTTGATGLAGCLDASDQSVRSRPPGTTRAGATETPTESYGPTTSGRRGHVTYYDPNDRGPYTDLQDALADVPDGGILQLGPADYDVPTEGRIELNRPVHVRGVGWSQEFPEPGTFENRNLGTRLLNSGEDAIDKPVIEYDAASKKQLKHVRLEHLFVSHTGDAPAVMFKDTSRTLMRECTINGGYTAPRGVVYDGECYLCRQEGTATKGFAEIGVDVIGKHGGDYMYEFLHSIAVTGVDGATAFKSEADRTVVIGGEYMSFGEDGVAMQFESPTTQSIQGALVIAPGIERTPNPIVVDGRSPFTNVQIFHTLLHLNKADPAGIQFKNATDCKIVNPIVPSTGGGELVYWSEEATNCTVTTDPNTLTRCTYTDDGSRNPHVEVVGGAPTAAMEVFPTGVPTTVSYNPDTGHPVFHDGESWRQVASRPFGSESGEESQ